MKTLDYRGLAALDAVLSQGSFDKAASALAITQSAVSQRVRALEEVAGRLLVVRGQPPTATPLGKRMIAHYRQVRLMEAALDAELAPGAGLPSIAVAVNADSLATWFPEALKSILAPPSCLLEVRVDDQDQTLRMLRDGSVFACVTSSQQAVAGTTATVLGVMRYVCAAAPSFAARWFPQGLTRDAALQAPALVFNRDDALHGRYLRQRLGLRKRFPQHAVPSSEAFVRVIEAGLAYGMVPMLQVQAALRAGKLIDLAPGEGLDIPLVWHAWNVRTPLTKELSKTVMAAAGKFLLPFSGK